MKGFKVSSIILILLSSLALMIAACGSGGGGSGNNTPPALTLTSIAVTPSDPSITLGSSQQFAATGTYSDNSTQDLTGSVTWTSSITGIAAVNSAGMAASASVGQTTVTAASEGVSGTTTLTVKSAVNLAKTGQTVSYAAGDDGDLRKGVAWPNPRFTVGTGVEAECVTDNLTGLVWVKNLNTGIGTWQQALDYANVLSLCGHDDWRVPNRKELMSLIDRTKYNPALPTGHPFSNVQASYYWSSTTYAYLKGGAWVVDMQSGEMVSPDKRDNYHVWPVRSGQ